MEVSDVTVVGAGLIGSAAARHLAESGLLVTLIGPPEGNPNRVHASHYDEARITRQIGTDPVWSNLARDAMHRYGEIESSSGIRFHRSCGHLRCDLPSEHPQSVWDLVRMVCRQRGTSGAERSHKEIRHRFPELAFQANSRFHWEGGPAGIINPRRLIEAQISLAKRAGTTVVRDVAVQVEKQGSAFAVRDSRGNTRISEKVLVAAGAYTNRFDLTPAKLALDVRPETVVLARVGGGLSSTLADMPSIVWRFSHIPGVVGVYVLPPVEYPDGCLYVKIGADHDRDISVNSEEAMHRYMTSDGSAQTRDLLLPVLRSLVPRLSHARVVTKPCLLTYTQSGYPMVDELEKGWFIAVGGCGKSAKSSDQIGKLASDMIKEVAWSGYSRSTFGAVRVS